MSEALNFVLTPVAGTPNYEFVEIEDDHGHGVGIGTWNQRPDGLIALRISREQFDEKFPATHNTVDELAQSASDRTVFKYGEAVGAMITGFFHDIDPFVIPSLLAQYALVHNLELDGSERVAMRHAETGVVAAAVRIRLSIDVEQEAI